MTDPRALLALTPDDVSETFKSTIRAYRERLGLLTSPPMTIEVPFDPEDLDGVQVLRRVIETELGRYMVCETTLRSGDDGALKVLVTARLLHQRAAETVVRIG